MEWLHVAQQHSPFEVVQIHPVGIIIVQPVVLPVVLVLLPVLKQLLLAFLTLLSRAYPPLAA